MNGLTIGLLVVFVGILLLRGLRSLDRKRDEDTCNLLVETAGSAGDIFNPIMVQHLPEPAQRYFRYTIGAETPIRRAVEIEMTGELGLGTKDKPNYRLMSAHQILAPPSGLVWKLRAGSISGSDGATPNTSWTRFWLFGLVPIVRVGGDEDHHRSAFGRVVAEGAFWAPASLLPGETVRWEPVDNATARAIVTFGKFEQAIDITVAADGQPTRVIIQRWSNANSDKTFREQPFGGDLSGFRDFAGYRLPTRVEGGNHFGTNDYFPFFKAEVKSIRFPTTCDRR